MSYKVNPNIQMLAAIIIPTGIYACKRINQTRKGLLIYGISIAVPIIVPYITSLFTVPETTYLTIIVYSALFSLGFPMIAIKQMSINYNKKINS